MDLAIIIPIGLVVLITGIAYRLQIDVGWFFGVCIGGAAAVYIMNVLPFQLTWWLIGKIAGN